MRTIISLFIVATVLVGMVAAASPLWVGNSAISDPTIRAALSTEAIAASEAARKLRDEGPAAVDRLVELRDNVVADRAADPPGRCANVDLSKLNTLIDEVGGQRYCHASGLYWHTDLESAIAESQRSGKPIMSLHMLGKLTDELSCANSRFFRTTLYANEEISTWLRTNCVMHWKSVRPVPQITIDFGDGRKLVRTVTGNSAHYLLDSTGQPVDCIPGLYGPQAFLRQAKQAHQLASEVSAASAAERPELIREYHNRRLTEMQSQWESDMNQIRLSNTAEALNGNPQEFKAAFEEKVEAAKANPNPPNAKAAALIAGPKLAVERPMLRMVMPRGADNFDKLAAGNVSEETWRKLAELYTEDAELDAASRALIAAENPNAANAGKLARSKRFVEDPLVRMLRQFQNTVALDTVRNEYEMHRRVHEWFADQPKFELTQLNSRVYAELFLTPESDPWLGLAPADAYSALTDNGVVNASTKPNNE